MENYFYSYLIVIIAPPCGFFSWGDGGSNAPTLASWGHELTPGAAVVIWGSPSSLAFFLIFLTFFDAAALQGKSDYSPHISINLLTSPYLTHIRMNKHAK